MGRKGGTILDYCAHGLHLRNGFVCFTAIAAIVDATDGIECRPGYRKCVSADVHACLYAALSIHTWVLIIDLHQRD